MGGESCPNPIENAVKEGGCVTTESIVLYQDSNCIGDISCATFNILAPIYKRLNGVRCESEFREYWFTRNQCILDRLLFVKSSIICLQQFWVGNEELVGMYERRLSDAGYVTYKLARTNNRGDGMIFVATQLLLSCLVDAFKICSTLRSLRMNLQHKVRRGPTVESGGHLRRLSQSWN